MLNLIPVVMLLLLQGAGGTDLSVRQQQALLDLAYRASTVQAPGGLERALREDAGVEGDGLAFWLQVFAPSGPILAPRPLFASVSPKVPVAGSDLLPSDEPSGGVRFRDGPSDR